MVKMAEQAAEMENVWDENLAFGSFVDSEETGSKNNEFVKGFVIGAGAGAAIAGGVFGGLWIKERRDNKKMFEILTLVNNIATEMDQHPDSKMLKWKKEEIDLTKMTMKNPLDLQLELKDRIEKTKFVSNKTKQKWNKELERLSDLSALYKKKEILAKTEAEIKATETVEEKK